MRNIFASGVAGLPAAPHPWAPTTPVKLEYCDYAGFSAIGIMGFGIGLQLGRTLVDITRSMYSK